MKLAVRNGITSLILRVKLLDPTSVTGAGKTGLAYNTSGLIISTIADNEATATAYTVAGSTIETISTLGTFAAPTATKCRFKEVDATNHPGLYEVQIADARWAVSNARSVIVTIPATANWSQVDAEVQLTPVPSDNRQWLGTTLPTPDTAGVPHVNVEYINNSAGAASALQNLMDSLDVFTLDTSVTTPTTSVFEITTANNQDRFSRQRIRVVGGGAYEGYEANILKVEFRTSTKCILTVETLPAALTSSEFVQIVGRASSSPFDMFPTYTVGSGSSTTEVRTDCTESSGRYLAGSPVIIMRAGIYLHAMDITGYSNTNGAFTLGTALPFTPAAGDKLVICGWIKTS